MHHRTHPRFVRFLVIALLLALLTPFSSMATETTEIENLRALAKLYGYVRFFHPSEEVAAKNWLTFMRVAVDSVGPAQTTDELEQALYDQFLPLAPTLELHRTANFVQRPETPVKSATLSPGAVAWQHQGVQLTDDPNAYLSIRTNQPNPLPMWLNYGIWLDQVTGAIEHRGREVRFRGAVKAAVNGDDNRAQLYLGVVGPNYQTLFYDDTDNDPIVSGEWSTFEITGPVANNALFIQFGVGALGSGVVWLDDFELSVRDPGGAWQDAALINPGFEDDDTGFFGWAKNPGVTDSWHLVDAGCHEGQRCAGMNARPFEDPTRLFDSVPDHREVIFEDIGAGLTCELPLVLGRDPSEEGPVTAGAPQLDESVAITDDFETSALPPIYNNWVPAIIEAWAILQHFYPYFDVVDVDWDAELTTALEGALSTDDTFELFKIFSRMIAALDDGHGLVYYPQSYSTKAWLPIKAAWIENQVVVLTDEGSDFETGDIIVTIDGVPAEQVMAEREEIISGSPQWKRRRALAMNYGVAGYGTTAEVVVDRNGETMTLSIPRGWDYAPDEPRPQQIAEIEPGVYYVDLSRASMGAIANVIDDLAAADGVIFDLRGYPNGNHDILCHLSDQVLQSAHWMVPQITHPDRKRIEGWDTDGRWILDPREPRITGRVAFLTDAQAISYAESVMGIVEAYQLGDIVGRTTAGANGNVNPISLFGGINVNWTGMKVLKHDGSQHHIVGIQPTVPVERTIAGVRAGIDEDLEAAIDLITN
jgi:hypothetical protein